MSEHLVETRFYFVSRSWKSNAAYLFKSISKSHSLAYTMQNSPYFDKHYHWIRLSYIENWKLFNFQTNWNHFVKVLSKLFTSHLWTFGSRRTPFHTHLSHLIPYFYWRTSALSSQSVIQRAKSWSSSWFWTADMIRKDFFYFILQFWTWL